MALMCCSVKVVGRAHIARAAGPESDRTATGAAAYRAGQRIADLKGGIVHDYRGKRGVDHAVILAPPGAPSWVHDRAALWNEVERLERRRDSQLFREVMVALPRELGPAAMIPLVRGWVQKTFVAKGMVADVCFHHLGSGNPHAHIMLTLRTVLPQGFGNKNRDWNDRGLVEVWRSSWSADCNTALLAAGSAATVDHRSYKRQGLDLEPTVHLGPTAAALDRAGIQTERGDENRRVLQQRSLLQVLRAEAERIRQAIRRVLHTLRGLHRQAASLEAQQQVDAGYRQHLERSARAQPTAIQALPDPIDAPAPLRCGP